VRNSFDVHLLLIENFSGIVETVFLRAFIWPRGLSRVFFGLLENLDNVFESRLKRGCIFAFFQCHASCVGRSSALGRSVVQRVLPKCLEGFRGPTP
jgi:hypothetical protein